MPDMSLKKNKMPVQEPEVRAHNFKEVAAGYTAELAVKEAGRCLQCKNPRCVTGCPVNVNIPAFIGRIAAGEFAEAGAELKKYNRLPAICGRVCPQETQCESRCVRGNKGEPVGIGYLERFAADYMLEHPEDAEKAVAEASAKAEAEAAETAGEAAAAGNTAKNSKGTRVAVIGSGPAGLTCAGELAGMGYDVTVFELLHVAGGVLMYGIPEFRLPKKLVQREIEQLKNMGVKIMTNMVIGKVLTVDELFEDGFEAVFVGTGAGLPGTMNMEGENLIGVYYANEFLTRINLMKAYKFPETDTPVFVGKNVAVVGGGNVAMDAARSALRMGAENVYIVYRRSEEEMPARKEEVEHAKEEGVQFLLLNNPIKLIGDENGWVKTTVCQRMKLGEPDEKGRRSPVPIQGDTFELETDTVVIAIGQSPNPLIKSALPDVEYNKKGCINVDQDTLATGREGVFAGGDIATGAATVILAMGAGKKAAHSIDEYLKKKSNPNL